MKYKHGSEVAYTTKGGNKGIGMIMIESGIPILHHNHTEIHNYNIAPGGLYNYGLQLPTDPVRAGYFTQFKILNEELEPGVIEKSTPQGKIFRRVYKEFDDLVFIGTIQKNIDDCSKPSAVITAMDMKYLKETGWKPVIIEESAEEKLKRVQKSKKY